MCMSCELQTRLVYWSTDREQLQQPLGPFIVVGQHYSMSRCELGRVGMYSSGWTVSCDGAVDGNVDGASLAAHLL